MSVDECSHEFNDEGGRGGRWRNSLTLNELEDESISTLSHEFHQTIISSRESCLL